MSDPMKSYEIERERRLEQAKRLQRDSTVNSAGRFPLTEAREMANEARIAEVQRQKERDLFRRMYPGRPLPKELQDGDEVA